MKPVGNVPIPFAAMSDAVDEERRGKSGNRGADSEDKDVVDVLLGVTQVLGRHTLLRAQLLVFGFQRLSHRPVQDTHRGRSAHRRPVVRTPPPGVSGPGGIYLFEHRPDSRTRQGLYAELRQDFSGKVLQLGYRYSTDDWEVDSHTLEGRFRFPLGESNYLEPHARYYSQSAASFYRYSLTDGSPLPEFASADARLADLDAFTVGLKYGTPDSGGNEWSTRLEFYRQESKAPAEQLIGNQTGNAPMPDFDAIILQFSYHFKL